MAGSTTKPRRITLKRALENDLATLDGALAGRETLVALARRLVDQFAEAEYSRDVAALAAELRQILSLLAPVSTASGDALDALVAEFGQAALGNPPNT